MNLVISFSFKNMSKIQIGGSLSPLSHSRRPLSIAEKEYFFSEIYHITLATYPKQTVSLQVTQS